MAARCPSPHAAGPSCPWPAPPSADTRGNCGKTQAVKSEPSPGVVKSEPSPGVVKSEPPPHHGDHGSSAPPSSSSDAHHASTTTTSSLSPDASTDARAPHAHLNGAAAAARPGSSNGGGGGGGSARPSPVQQQQQQLGGGYGALALLPPSSGKGGGGKRGEGAGGLLFQVAWHRVVLDEAQSIKNPHTLVAQAAWGLAADYRWCLSGTPIQNSVRASHALLVPPSRACIVFAWAPLA